MAGTVSSRLYELELERRVDWEDGHWGQEKRAQHTVEAGRWEMKGLIGAGSSTF